MKTYLVTGGCGFIGSNYILNIISNPENFVINLDKLTYASNKKYLKSIQKYKNYKFIKGDICNTKLVEKIFKKYNINYVINFAAESHVDNSYLNPELFFKTNATGVKVLLDNIKKYWKDFSNRKFIQISTDEVYGSSLQITNKNSSFNNINNIEKEFKETSLYNPSSPYAESKTCAEVLIKKYFKLYSLPIIIIRPTNNFGINQHPEKLIPKVFLACFNNKNVLIHGSGTQMRDFISVIDQINAINLLIQNGKVGEIYNISANNHISVIEIVNKIINFYKTNYNNNLKSQIEYVKDRPNQDLSYNLNSNKIKKLGFKITTNFEEELFKTLTYYYNNINLLKNAKKAK